MLTLHPFNQETNAILDHLFVFVISLDEMGRVVDINQPILDRSGLKKNSLLGQYLRETPFWNSEPTRKNQLVTSIKKAQRGEVCRYDTILTIAEAEVPVDLMLSPILNEQKQQIGLLVTANDISKRKALEDKLVLNEERYRFVVEGSELGFWDWDIEHDIVERNSRWAEMLGYSHKEIAKTTKQWSDFIFPDDRKKAWDSIMQVLDGRAAVHRIEYRMLHKNGGIRWVLDQAKVMKFNAEGKPIRMCGTHTDITDRKNLEMELEKQAHLDFLTGLDNRRYFFEKAEREFNRASRYDQALSMLMMDIDHFKKINDLHGHKTGDSVLQKLADIFRYILREIDVVGRVGGEEFAILLPATNAEGAKSVAERLRKSIETATFFDGVSSPLSVTASFGVATFNDIGVDNNLSSVEDLLNLADTAMYQAKELGRNQVIFSESIKINTPTKMDQNLLKAKTG